MVVVITSVILKLPRFFQFQLITVDGETDYWTTSIMEDPVYIRFSSYWDDLITTGFLPLAILIFFNLRIYLKVFYIWSNCYLDRIYLKKIKSFITNSFYKLLVRLDQQLGKNEMWPIHWNRCDIQHSKRRKICCDI